VIDRLCGARGANANAIVEPTRALVGFALSDGVCATGDGDGDGDGAWRMGCASDVAFKPATPDANASANASTQSATRFTA
jgi:hypothetical protein